MPSALLRACSGRPGCPQLVSRGKCADCSRAAERARGNSGGRGYGSTWRAFRFFFFRLLIAAGITPVCGVSLPGGPVMTMSLCRQRGILQ